MTIEDCLDIALGFHPDYTDFRLDREESVLFSIQKQISRGLALTDRQHALVKRRLAIYSDQFTQLGITLANCCEKTKQPLRHIDRSRYITTVSHEEMIADNILYESRYKNIKWIKIRFSFSKKLAAQITNIKNHLGEVEYHHTPGSNEHYFRLTEQSLYWSVKYYKDLEFEIDSTLLELYNTCEDIVTHKLDYVSSIVNYEFVNCGENAKQYMTQSLGEPCDENIILYKDRSRLLGLDYVDTRAVTKNAKHYTTLTNKIINRNKNRVFVNSTEWSFDDIIESLIELERFPVAVFLYFEQLSSDYNEVERLVHGFDNVVDSSLIHKDFVEILRHDNEPKKVDKSHKVVYHSSYVELNPGMIDTDWKPLSIINIGCSYQSPWVSEFVDTCDLSIYWDKTPSVMMTTNSDNSFLKGLEKL